MGSMCMQVRVDIELYRCISAFLIYTKIRILLGYGIQFGGIAFDKNSSSAGYLVGSMYHACQNAGAAGVIMKTGQYLVGSMWINFKTCMLIILYTISQ